MFKSAVLLGGILTCCGLAFAYAESPPLKVCMVSGSFEYDSDTSLTMFKEYLEEGYNADVTLLKAAGWTDIPGLEALDDCDVALFFARRLRIEGEQLERVIKYCEAGRPIVAVRTASHGFQNYLQFDKEVLGGNYHDHFGEGPTAKMEIDGEAKDHPILQGVMPMRSRYSLYKTEPLAEDTQLLMTGSTPQSDGPQPVTWTRVHNGGRVFYTAMGGLGDFQNNSFKRMLANALFWAAERDVDRKPLPEVPRRSKPEGTLTLKLRTRLEEPAGSDNWVEKTVEKGIPVAETAILICDMWDKHWCTFASKRCEQIAKLMDVVVEAARKNGVQIIHAPSDTLDFYMDSPQRRRMQITLKVNSAPPLHVPDPPLPIDDSDGGCPDDQVEYRAWTRQSPHIKIGELDGISDNGREILGFLQQEGIKNLIIMGVHTNMCILNRSFAIKQMTRWGMQCYLVRDLTDTMYDPADPPYVSHDEGTELVVQHIEKYWCPSLLSEDLLNGLPEYSGCGRTEWGATERS